MHGIVGNGVHDAGEGDVEFAIGIFGVEGRHKCSTTDHLEPVTRERMTINNPVRHKDERDSHRVQGPKESADCRSINRDMQRAVVHTRPAAFRLFERHLLGLEKVVSNQMSQKNKYEQVCHRSLPSR